MMKRESFRRFMSTSTEVVNTKRNGFQSRFARLVVPALVALSASVSSSYSNSEHFVRWARTSTAGALFGFETFAWL